MRRLYKGERERERGGGEEKRGERENGELGQLGLSDMACETVGVGAHYKTA